MLNFQKNQKPERVFNQFLNIWLKIIKNYKIEKGIKLAPSNYGNKVGIDILPI